MEAPSSAGGFFYELIFVVLSFLPNCVRFFICSILCSFGLNQKNQKFKASESSAKMFARKPKTSETRLSAQTTEVFTAPSLHFYASLSGGRTSFAFNVCVNLKNISLFGVLSLLTETAKQHYSKTEQKKRKAGSASGKKSVKKILEKAR